MAPELFLFAVSAASVAASAAGTAAVAAALDGNSAVALHTYFFAAKHQLVAANWRIFHLAN